MPLVPGRRLGPYEILGPLGAGGMGEVYRAKDLRLGREVAIKVLPPEVASNPDRLARFEREARAVAALNHPNIVTLFSVEDEEGVRFLTMELVEGQSLLDLVTPGGLPLSRVLELSIPLADALVAAHERGVIHRDLKPSNVMVTREGRVKVLDFGLAKLIAEEPGPDATQATTATSPISMPGKVVGTVPYMAPEQLRGEPVDVRADLFALGILLYELSTGRRPFRGATYAEVASAILRDVPEPAQIARADLPRDLGRIIDRCLEKDPDRRIQTAKDVRNELDLVRRGVEPGAASTPRAGTADAISERNIPSIAVLPFANRSRDEGDEFFADGITEDVIAQLCKVRTLKVISRRSVMPFKNREESVQEVASRLRVAHVLEGSIRRVGNRVRIVAQLIDVDSGRHLWAETFDRQLTDIFAIQTEVALHIGAALKAELSPDEQGRILRRQTKDMLAYEHYLRGRHCLARYTIEGLRTGIEHFERAIERDPEFAMAHVGLAVALADLMEQGALRRDEGGPRAVSTGVKAVSLDPELGDAHCALAYARSVFEFDYVSAEAGFKRALELSPGSADTYDLFGRMCAGLERYDEAIALLKRAHELDPLTHRADLATALLRVGRTEEAERITAVAITLDPQYPRLHATHGWALFRQGRTEEGLAELERAVTLSPGEDMWLAQLGQAYALAGRTEQAMEVLRELEDPSRATAASPYHLAYVYTGLGDTERAMDCLERALEEGTGALSTFQGSFLFAPLRHHPRFAALLKKMRRD